MLTDLARRHLLEVIAHVHEHPFAKTHGIRIEVTWMLEEAELHFFHGATQMQCPVSFMEPRRCNAPFQSEFVSYKAIEDTETLPDETADMFIDSLRKYWVMEKLGWVLR